MGRFVMIFLYLALLGAWLTSIFYCVANTEWLAVIVMHVFLPPIGVIHGICIWFGGSWF